jgi:ribonuclease P/MRP protein subunit RPP1
LAKFVDLHLSPSWGDAKEAGRLVAETARLGFRAVALATTRAEGPQTQRSVFEEDLSTRGVEAVRRLNLQPSTPEELLKDLRVHRRNFEVVSVTCETDSLARLAARDSRVDLLRFPLSPRLQLFGEVEAELASGSNAALEVDMASVVGVEEYALPRVLRELRRRLRLAERFKVPVVVSSGAADVYGLRSPRDMAAFLRVLGLPPQAALKAVSRNPAAIIQRNREKLDSSFVGVGVRLVKEAEGKDG